MKTRRYFSTDLRSAVLTIRNELGSNAVILSHKKTNDGIEVTAAAETEILAAASSLVIQSALPRQPHLFSMSSENETPDNRFPLNNKAGLLKNGTGAHNGKKNVAAALNGNDSCKILQQDSATRISPATNSTTRSGMDSESMNKFAINRTQARLEQEDKSPVSGKQNGMNNLISLIEQQVAEHAWGDIARKNPLRARLIREMLKMDFHPIIIQKMTDAMSGGNYDAKSILPQALELIAGQLPIYQEDITACGGTVALFGATGAGKTTTIAKLAARYAMRHGCGQVALITTDNQRIAAHEQLRIYSGILGIPFKAASDADELLDALNEFSEKSFILIDTAGMGPGDFNTGAHHRLFSGGLSQVRNFLVLPATAHRKVLEHSATAFRDIKLDGSIITKLDETVSLGGPLSLAILNNLPVAYYSNGQKIPDDFHLARAHNLVSRAVGIADQFAETQSVKDKSQDKTGIEANVGI
ncbi:MAG: flagellar biosynthesis protein FlhF [Gammaproteobacteria bacterium]|nr:flagellar biosynthesis protein FlhF [Gammaproteobacteria bacterium]